MRCRVVCDKCKNDLIIKSTSSGPVGIIIVVESCNNPECTKLVPEENSEYEKVLSDMVRFNSYNESSSTF